MRSTYRSSMAVLALLLFSFLFFIPLSSLAFDISAYWDPVSVVQLEGQWGLGNCSRDQWISAVGPDNYQVLRWYHEMGITDLCVHYRSSDFTNYLGTSGESLAVMNERWPNRMYQN